MNSKKILSIFVLWLILTLEFSYLMKPTRLFASANPDGGPDLRISGASFFPTNPIAGARATLMVTVDNVGDSTASPIVVQVSWGCSQLVNGTSELAGGSSTTVLFYPLFLHAGKYPLDITVDPNNNVQEQDETNNNMIKDDFEVKLFKVTRPPSDLNFEAEQGTWGGLPPKDQLPTVHGIPNYDLLGRKDPNNPSSDFEAQGDTSACGTTSLAGILRYLSGKDDTVYNHHIIDRSIRGGDRFDVFTDPFSIARYASGKGFEARVYVDGDFEKIKWFLDRGIPVAIAISTKGEKSVMTGHWVVPICYWEDSTKTTGLSSPFMIGYYNPWGEQSAIPESRFELYWMEQEVIGITLWNRVYVAICNRPASSDMPPSNAGAAERLYMWVVEGLSANLDAWGTAIRDIESGNFGQVVVGLLELIGAAASSLAYLGFVLLPTLIGSYIVKGLKIAFEWIGEQLRALGCKWFGWGCHTKKEYFFYFYSRSPTCESNNLVNDMIKQEAVGYIFKDTGEGRVPIYEYAMLDATSHAVTGYFISTNPDLGELVPDHPELRRYYFATLGYALTAEIPGVPCNKLDASVQGVGYDESIFNLLIPQYYSNGSRALWLFTSTTSNCRFLSTDEDAGTRTFPYVAIDETGFHFTRDYIVGYIHYNQLPGTVPLFRFYDKEEDEFYLTTNLEESPKELRPVKEMVFSGVVGYIFQEQKPGTVPLYRYYASERGADYLFTTKEITSDNFTKEAIIGYVYPYKEECTTELWLFCYRSFK